MNNQKKKNKNYTISRSGEYIYIDWHGKRYVTEYTKEIKRFLSSDILGTFTNSGEKNGCYPKFKYIAGTTLCPYLHHVIFCLHYRGMNRNNYIDVLKAFQAEIDKGHKFHIDHLDGDLTNCCSYNLNMVTPGDHAVKTGRERCKRLKQMRKGKHIFHVTKVNDGQNIRVEIAYISSTQRKSVRVERFYCKNNYELNNLLTLISYGDFWSMVNSRSGAVCNDGTYFVTGDVFHRPTLNLQRRKYELQRNLVNLPLSDFLHWNIQGGDVKLAYVM